MAKRRDKTEKYLDVLINFGIHRLIQDEKKRRRLEEDIDSAPIVSIGPSGLGGPYQREWPE